MKTDVFDNVAETFWNSFNTVEAEEAQECIKHALEMLKKPHYETTPTWLLNDWIATTWKTFAGKRTRLVNGKWVGTENVVWDIALPNGSRLTDERYASVLEICKRMAALYRDGIVSKNAPALKTWAAFCIEIKRIVGWAVLNEKTLRPEEYGLSLLDQSSLQRLFNDVAEGGWTNAFLLPDRVVGALYKKALGVDCPSDVLRNLGSVPKSDRDAICRWISEQDGYSTHCVTRGIVSRRFLASILNCDVWILSSPRFSAIVRQFEPEHENEVGLLLPAGNATEFPSHGAITVEQARTAPMTPGAVRALQKILTNAMQMHHYFPEFLPDPISIDPKKALRTALRRTLPAKHTPFMPIPIGLKYLGEALRWVDEYGDALVDFYLQVVRATRQGGRDDWKKKISGRRQQEKLISKIGIPVELAGLGKGLNRIYTNSSVKIDFEALRNRPSLHQAMECFIGAVVISIGMLKPSRSHELTSVARECLVGDGPYWFDSELAKATVKEYRVNTEGKPIPDITARAIQQIQRLGRELAKINDDRDEYATSRLFYLPTRTFGVGKVPRHAMLDRYLNRFCDYVGLPVDSLGRRWYVRIHEMRKWFLLLLVWSGRFNVLDAARSIAGHTNVRHLQAYIERESPHDAICAVESMYAADKLRHFEENGCPNQSEEGLNDLYEKVLKKFNVSALEMIPSREWESYLRQLHDDGEFSIELYELNVDSSVGEVCVAFRSTRKDDDAK